MIGCEKLAGIGEHVAMALCKVTFVDGQDGKEWGRKGCIAMALCYTLYGLNV